MSIMDDVNTAGDWLIIARAALERMREDVHARADECGPGCADYHDAMRGVSQAAEAIGLPVRELVREARVMNGDYMGLPFPGEL
jgi:hypothetical protein